MAWSGGSFGETRQPYRDLSRAGAGFTGPGRETPDPEGLRGVRIGVIGPERSAQGASLRRAVDLALREANGEGGFRGIPYEAVFRADDGPWGVGAKQVAALAYEDSVWAVIGGLEGGDAHLAELVAAKVWIPVVTPAADFTIDYANVPWVFRCSPSDAQQAEALVTHARGAGHRQLFALTEGDREGRTGLRRLEDACRKAGLDLIGRREYVAHRPEVASVPMTVDAVVIWGRSGSGLSVLRRLRSGGYRGPILAPATFLSPELEEARGVLGEVLVAAPYDLRQSDGEVGRFRGRYVVETGKEPDAVAVLAYDAAKAVIAAIEAGGLNRARIRDALAELGFDGVVGSYRFDGLGGTTLRPVVMRLGEGGWESADDGPSSAEAPEGRR